MGRKADTNRLQDITRYVEEHPGCKPIDIAQDMGYKDTPQLHDLCRCWRRGCNPPKREWLGPAVALLGNTTV